MAIDLQDEIVVRVIGDDAAATRLVASEALPTGKIARITLAELQTLIATPPVVKAFMHATMDEQSTNLDAGKHIEFDDELENDGSGAIVLSSGGGDQTDGLISLAAGKIYELTASLQLSFSSAAGVIDCSFRNNTAAAVIGTRGKNQPLTWVTNNVWLNPVATAIIDTTAGAVEVELRILSSSAVFDIPAFEASFLKVIEIG